MANPYQGTPDLASILRTLSSFTPQAQASSSTVFQDSSNFSANQPSQDNTHHIRHHGALSNLLPQRQQLLPSKQTDPTTIIEWSAGLKHITKQITTNEYLIKEIRRLIETSHSHEEQWWAGRLALLQKQEARIEGQKRLNDALAAVGALSTQPQRPASEIAAEEITTYDLKVYRAQHQMVKEMSMRLRDLGVPFFGTKVELIKLKKDEGKSERKDVWDGGVKRRFIAEEELVEFQRKMLGFLETMCEE